MGFRRHMRAAHGVHHMAPADIDAQRIAPRPPSANYTPNRRYQPRNDRRQNSQFVNAQTLQNIIQNVGQVAANAATQGRAITTVVIY